MNAATRRISGRLALSTALVSAGLAIGGPAMASPVAAGSSSAAVQQAAVQQAAQNLGYEYTYSLGIPWPQSVLQTPQSITSEVTSNFAAYFPFSSDCARLPAVGGVCNLYNVGLANPIQVVERTATSFTFMSLPGHAEGAYRYIRFTFYKVGADPFGDLRLQVSAWGPWTVAAAATISSGTANYYWSQFAANVGRAYQ
ncbi:MAG TPA: hypothetical protein VK453_00895 [Micromonosporaceae bacterium]|nr:hypothetical protein [Micromonosporaceae bacterium]